MHDILIVEDGYAERERLRNLFATAQFSVSCAESADEAEELASREQFRLAILDIGLADKSGTHLFERFKRTARIPYIIILTGNPSVHLKQRFLDEGAVAYIVKASSAAANDTLLELVRSLLGAGSSAAVRGIPLADFVKQYLDEASRQLFMDADNKFSHCAKCGSTTYVVSFAFKTQMPPQVEGKVICSACGTEMDPEII